MKGWHSLPTAVYSLVERTPRSVLLESARPNSKEQTSRIFLSPLRVLEAREPTEVAELFAQIERAVRDGQVVAGFFTYECGQAFEPKAQLRPTDAKIPLAWFGTYDRAYLFDHLHGEFVDGEPPGLAELSETAPSPHAPPETNLKVAASLSEPQFADRIEAIHEWIRAGDVYQLNFTFPLNLRTANKPAALYANLRARQPVEYGALIHWQPDRYILSFSPELFFRIDQAGTTRHIVTRPMKGTAPRGRTNAEDAHIAEQLRNDEKNRSENVMIVDLLRNDLGRLCNFGSVTVEELFAVERYPTLWQMTSTITGALRADVGYHDIFRALFPCGSVTGAPKVRAMQLLAQLEAAPRSVYTGAIGFFAREQTVFNVAIRTLQLDEENASMGVGSGIVIDSNASDEYRECLLKAEFLNNTTESFSLIETMKWQGEYSLLDLHLDRLEDSAAYFDFPCDRKEIKSILLQTAMNFPNRAPRKVRLLLDEAERIHIEHEILPPLTEEASPAQVRIANQRTDARDRFLCHKTTNRPVYAEAIKAAAAAGFADVLFLNHEGQVTEGAISNIFIEKDSRWFTPPVVCGLLNGIYRRHLLATRPEIQEKILSIDDMKTATAIYLTNAVRGLRQVTIDWNHKL
jgi:para-aminobenzoate synthetase / 4-amino-4-deoxychorismate lyase